MGTVMESSPSSNLLLTPSLAGKIPSCRWWVAMVRTHLPAQGLGGDIQVSGMAQGCAKSCSVTLRIHLFFLQT